MKTNKLMVVACLLFFVCTATFAQQVSIEGGHISTQYKGMLPFTEYKGGFQLGVGYVMPIKDSSWYLKTGLHYQQLNGEGTVNYFNQINEVVLSYQKTQEIYYLQIPLLLQWEAPSFNKIRFGLQAGLTGNYLLRAWHNPQSRNLEHNVSSDFQRLVFGYQAGAYTQYKLSPTSSLQLSYLFGSNLSSVQKQASAAGFNSHTIAVGLVYNLH